MRTLGLMDRLMDRLPGDDTGTNLPAAISIGSVQNIFMRARSHYAAGNIACVRL
jgi:hypothetical protein